MLINCLRGTKRKARGTQKPGHIQKYVEVASTAQHVGAVREPLLIPTQTINQRFTNVCCLFYYPCRFFAARRRNTLQTAALTAPGGGVR